MRAQTSFLDEIIVDNFAGGGGASVGMELATGRVVDIAINHDPDAVRMHKTNHPYTRHLCESVWNVDPVKECAGRPVGLAWFSPDCKHFSKAKGSKPVDKNIRGLAWIVLRWAALVRPRIIILENVEEFKTWGPVRRGKPIKAKAGQTFNRWLSQLESLGYIIEHRELVAADFGTPTIRKRFFLVARCDGRPIVWPEPTHNKNGTGGKKKWRSAAEIIDWSLPCPSIFDSRQEVKARYGVNAIRPLADNTLRRVARGVDKFVIKNAQPFIVQCKFNNEAEDTGDPLRTVTSVNAHLLCKAALTMHNNENAAGTDVTAPLNTITGTGAGGHQMLITPSLVQVNHAGEFRGQEVTDPLQTITGKNGCGIIAPSLIQYHDERAGEYVRGQNVKEPIMTIDGSNRYAMAAAHMTEYYGNAERGFSLTEPTHTATARDREGLTLAFMSKFYSGGHDGKGNSPEEPLNTITAGDHNAVAATFVSKFYGTGTGQNMDEPLHTITQSAGHFGEVRTRLVKWDGRQELHHWPKVRALLNNYCGYSIADDEVLVLEIGGGAWFISDIGLRMLTPRELYAANGFPPDYIIDRDHEGREYNKTLQVARCGNAVPPLFAKVLTAANWPEACTMEINTMAELGRCVAL